MMTEEQHRLATHPAELFVRACPGAGKSSTIVERVQALSQHLPPRKGIAVLSFTNAAVDEFIVKYREKNMDLAIGYPSFIGTFDSFIRSFIVLPAGIPGIPAKPLIVESWESMDITVILRGPERTIFPVSLDRFDPATNAIDAATIGHRAQRQHVSQRLADYQREAGLIRSRLRSKGYLSAADARHLAAQKLNDSAWATAIGKALASRFQEIIIDEAQDCNSDDLKILSWLRSHCIPVTVVCDPDQAIYQFRNGDPAHLHTYAQRYDVANQHTFTGNFRSSQPICDFSATLRSRPTPDEAKGEHATVSHPVQLLFYNGAISGAIGQQFSAIVHHLDASIHDQILLAHARKNALIASGNLEPTDDGDSNLSRLAKAVYQFFTSSASNRDRERSLLMIDKLLLTIMGKIDEEELPSVALQRNKIPAREVRRKSLKLITSLPSTCTDTAEGRTGWLEILYRSLGDLGIPFPAGRTARSTFPNRLNTKWPNNLQCGSASHCPYSTIHQVKGKQFDAVCTLLPKDRAPDNLTTHLFNMWERRTDDEAKRVVYVGATRAKKIMLLALPAPFETRITRILTVHSVSFAAHRCP